VLEFDFLKRRDRTSDCYRQMRFLGSSTGSAPDPAGGAFSTPPDPLPGFEGPLRLLMLIKVPVCFNLVLVIYSSYILP